MTDKNYTFLMNAIILQAVKDYRLALRYERDLRYNQEMQHSYRKLLRECERFFRSEWFSALTTVNGNTIIKKLRKEVDDANIEFLKNKKVETILKGA